MIHCWILLQAKRQIGGHAYGGVYSGPIGADLTPLLEGYESWKELPYASSLCGACSEVCPVKIPLHDLLIEHRKDEVNQGLAPVTETLAIKGFGLVTSHPALYQAATKLAGLGMGLIAKDGFIEKGSGLLGGWTDVRDLPQPAKESFRDWWNKQKSERNE